MWPLIAHELIKIRVFSNARDERAALLARICTELSAAPVQHLGKVLIIWRPAPRSNKRSRQYGRSARPKAVPHAGGRSERSDSGRASHTPAVGAAGNHRCAAQWHVEVAKCGRVSAAAQTIRRRRWCGSRQATRGNRRQGAG
jgi:hypothetical protein